jgi:MYXO-CTERM domain-containing protein
LAQAVLYENWSVGKTYIYEDIYHNTTMAGAPVQNLVSYIYSDGGPGGAPEPRDAALVLSGLALIMARRFRKPIRPTAR